MQTLQLDNQTARKLYPTAIPEFKAMLEQSFPSGFFSQNICQRITSFEAACEENGENPNATKFTIGTDDEIAYKQLKEIAKALRQGVKLDSNNSSQRKWYPIHEFSASGFRFCDSYCVRVYERGWRLPALLR